MPRKITIDYGQDAARSRYSADVFAWTGSPTFTAETFEFKLPSVVKRIEIADRAQADHNHNASHNRKGRITVKIKFHGAAGGEVTGSAYLVQTKHARILVDCGMFQGGREAAAKNRPPEAARRGKLDAVVLTHGHLDHTGRLPLLAKLGYTGPVYATPATLEMTALILRDSARLQLQDTERQNRRRERAGEPPLEPLYTPEHAEAIIPQFKAVPYQKPVTVAPGIQACWAEAGHMLGSASIQLLVEEDGRTKRVVFSGDLGPKGAPILRDYEPFQQADMVFMESTYGDHDHRPFRETVDEYVDIVKDAVQHGGKILVPTFAVGRAQLLTLLLSWMFRKGKVKPFPVFLDSPMAIEATRIYTRHVELFDDEMRKYMSERPLREDLKTLKATESADESKAINDCQGTVPGDGRRRHVQRRAHPAPSPAEPLEARDARSHRRLPGARIARATAGRGREVRSASTARRLPSGRRSTPWADSAPTPARRTC